MPLAVIDESNTILSYVNTIVTLLGVIWALWTAAWHLNLKRATKHLGSICQDEDLMGWFVAQLPGWWTQIFPFGMRRVPLPRVPGISTLLEAGDAGVFTSSLFDSIRHGRKQVSWIPIYETFFIEAAWNCLEQWSLDQETQDQDPLDQRGDVARFLEALWGFYRKLFRLFAGHPRPSAVGGSPPEQNVSVQRRAAERVWMEIRFAEGKDTNWVCL
jgi:hypothetical protein